MLIQAVGAGQLWQTRARGWEWDRTGVTEDQGLGQQGSNLAGRFKALVSGSQGRFCRVRKLKVRPWG